MEKKIKKTTTKRSPAKKPATKRGAKKQIPQKTGGNGPFYVVVIIILITVIVLLVNKFYESGMFRSENIKSPAENTGTVKEPVDAQKNIPPDKKPVDNKDAANAAPKIDDKKVDDKKSDDKKADDLVTDKEVLLYFLQFDEKTEKVYLKTVKRKLSDKQILLQTINQLIKGPSSSEEGKGYITAVPPNLRLRSVTINGKIAEIDFNNAIEEGATGDILLKRIQQIVYTATQFDDVDSIVIKINGQRRKTIGGDGFSISGPLKRW